MIQENSALVVVDMLYDFIDGSLACQNAQNAVSEALDFIQKHSPQTENDEAGIAGGFPILFIRDHHPWDHSSFKDYGGIWPVHCVAGTRGGEIHDSLRPYAVEELTFDKGCDRGCEQYSGFDGRNSAGQSLGEILGLLDADVVYVCGIATEFCVKNTVEDLFKAGFPVCVLEKALSYVDYQGHLKAVEEMKAEGIRFE